MSQDNATTADRVHFIGVGGSGMSAVARLIAARGYDVSGSDRGESAYFRALRDAGMDVRVGHDPALVEGARAVVVSTAIRETNPELARARELGIDVWHRSEALVRALEGQRIIAVAGTHGKTTTSAMVAHVLHHCGIDASYAVGARVFGIEGAVAGGYAGTSGIAVVEADESDGSFLRYDADVAILLNVEPDHLDYYGTAEAMEDAYATFATAANTLVVCGDDEHAVRIADASGHAADAVVTYGHDANSDVIVADASMTRDGESFLTALTMPGDHNRLNAAAAWIAATQVGADPDRAAEALATFAGTGRRYQLRGIVDDVKVIDDYAHHPTEVTAVLRAARESGVGRMVVLFQPALFTRTQAHSGNFAHALSLDDVDVVIAGVHGDREDPIEGVNSQLIADQVVPGVGSTVTVVEDLADAAGVAANLVRPGDTVLTVGSGTVTLAADWILGALERRSAGGSAEPNASDGGDQ
ncbi:UDP-N-acetylmuramate--L-alanine ligase [Demequina aurantiaca]|uniref:UDP-N-acetylmuramate--L-alanine ligase n=1 Tax=Demequina aurantiaca TaxID=676200 RepID=UPI0007848E3F|nr:UDP-N-acetylmuramate--L-alanine ligase [Demequina aurantiaca]